MVSQGRRICGRHVPCTSPEGNLTIGNAARCAAGVKGINFRCFENTGNNFESKKMVEVDFDQYVSGSNWYGIFQDKIPWLRGAIRIYSDINAICRNKCTDNCGVCRIRKSVDLIVEQHLTMDRMAFKDEMYEGSSCGFRKPECQEEKEVAGAKRVSQQQKSTDNVACRNEIEKSRSVNLKPQRKLCKFCGLKHRLGSRFCRSFGKMCIICQGLNHHASVCWFRGSSVMRRRAGSKSSTPREERGAEKKIVENKKGKENNARINEEERNIDSVQEKNTEILKSEEKVADLQQIVEVVTRPKQTSDKSPLTQEEALGFINKKLNRKYASFSPLKNGKALAELLKTVSGYEVYSKDIWEDMRDILIMEDKENDISIEKLKCSSVEEIVKFTYWLKCADEELQSKKNHMDRKKDNCCNLRI